MKSKRQHFLSLIPATVFFSLILLITILTTQCFAWKGKVVGVTDGDTITVMDEGKGEKIRLYGIDTSEKRQPYGKKAKQFTSDMVYRKVFEVIPITIEGINLVLLKGQKRNNFAIHLKILLSQKIILYYRIIIAKTGIG